MDDIRREAIEEPGLVQNQHNAMVEAKSNKNKKRYRMMFAKMRLEVLRRFGVDEEYEPPF